MISVVIPTYNEENNIQETLESVSKQTIPRDSYEIIVVDGGSRDRTREIAKKYADKVIIQKSPGVGGARNDGVRAAQNDLIATTDADVLVPNTWLEKILANFEDKTVVAVCGLDNPREKTAASRLTFKLLRTFIRATSRLGYYCLGGTNSAFKKAAFLNIDGYRNLPHSDDVDLGFRMRKIGKIVFDKDIDVAISTRRFEKQGYMKVLWIWFKGDLRLFMGKSIPKIDYAKQTY